MSLFRLTGWVALVVTLSGPLLAQDIGFKQRTTLDIQAVRGGGFEVSEQTQVDVRYVSERSTRGREFAVGDPHYAPLRDFEGTWNGERIAGEHFHVRTPQRADVFLVPGAYQEVVTPEAPASGDELMYRYQRTYSDIAYTPIVRVPDVDRVESFEIIVAHPEDVEVSFDVFSPRGEISHQISHGETVTRLVFAPIGRAESLPLFGHGGSAAQVLVHAQRAGQPILPTTPDAFGQWYSELTVGARPDALSPRLAAIADGLEAATPTETVAAIHDYVRGSVRYIADERGGGAIIPRAPDLVVDNGYGDCKDRAFLASALAGHLGLDVDVVLLATAPVADFDAAHVSLYDHAISAWDGPDGATVYFDPTHRHVAFGSLPESDISARALRLSDGSARQVVVPAPASAPMLDITIESSLDAPADAVAQVTVRGERLGAVRQAMTSGREVDVENVMSAIVSASLNKIRLDDFRPVSMTADSAIFQAVADLSEFVIASPTRRYVPHTPFSAVPSEVSQRTGDVLPIWTPDRPDVRLVLDLDAGELAADSASVRLGDASVAAFAADVAPGQGRARIVYRFRQNARRFDGADRDTYVGMAQAYLDARRDMFVFRPVVADAP